jgi:hypothetical protein
MMQVATPWPCVVLAWLGPWPGIGADYVLVTVYEVIRRLPGIPAVRERSRAMAMLDAILCREYRFRYYSFDLAWSSTEALASMDNGSGDEYSIVFSPVGAYARAFDHESPMSPWRCDPPEAWPGLFDMVPEVFRQFVQEPSFCEEGIPLATACFWRHASAPDWSAGEVEIPSGIDDADGAGQLFHVLVGGTAEAYGRFAERYYQVTADLAAIQHVYDLKPLTPAVAWALNPDVQLGDLAEDIAQIGYPVQDG